MNRRALNRINRVAEKATWYLFAKTANDRKRLRYWRLLARVHKRDITQRSVAASILLPEPTLEIPKEIGFAATSLDAMGFSMAIVDEVRRLAPETAASQTGKPYLMAFAVSDLDKSSPLLQFAMSPAVLAPAAKYLGMIPRLTDINIMSSPGTPGEPSGSQLFHSDYEDVRQVKIFIHCSDVKVENGPLTAITAWQSRQVKRAINYRYGGPGFRVADQIVTEIVPESNFQQFTGPSGSVTYIDTSSCLHFGSRIRPGTAPRLAVQFQYLTPPAFELALMPGLRHKPVAKVPASNRVDELVLGRR